MPRLCACKIGVIHDVSEGGRRNLEHWRKSKMAAWTMVLWGKIKRHRNIFRINFFIREAGKLGLLHLVFPSDSAGVWELPWHRNRKAGRPVDLFTDMYWRPIFLFLKRFDLLTWIIHLLPLRLASGDNLAWGTRLSLSYLLCMFSLLICFGRASPSPWRQPAGWGELWDSNMAYFVFTGSSFLP